MGRKSVTRHDEKYAWKVSRVHKAVAKTKQFIQNIYYNDDGAAINDLYERERHKKKLKFCRSQRARIALCATNKQRPNHSGHW